MTTTPPPTNDDAAAKPELIEPSASPDSTDSTDSPDLVMREASAEADEANQGAGGDGASEAPPPDGSAKPPVPATPTAPAADDSIAPAPPAVQTVYVTPPVAPTRKGNRGFGVLFAFLGTAVFALLFVGAMAVVLSLSFPGETAERLTGFIANVAFVGPLAVYFVAFMLLVLLANRARWGAYVFGSFIVAVIVYFGSIGVTLLTMNVFGMTPEVASDQFRLLAITPWIIIATILSREITIWLGAAIASRGRKVTARNLEARAAYERELDNQPIGFA